MSGKYSGKWHKWFAWRPVWSNYKRDPMYKRALFLRVIWRQYDSPDEDEIMELFGTRLVSGETLARMYGFNYSSVQMG